MTTNNNLKMFIKSSKLFFLLTFIRNPLMKLMALVEGCMDPTCFIEKRNL